jgi:hypothetical protein
MPKVAICIPVHGDTKALFTLSLAGLLLASRDHELRVDMGQGTILPDIRNGLVSRAKAWEADYILWLDADHTFPEDSLLRLLAHRKPIAGCNYPRRRIPDAPTAVKDGKPVFTTATSAGLEQVESLGLGVCLMETAVFDGLEQPYFGFALNSKGTGFVGEDVGFFRRVRVPPFVDHSLSWQVGHIADHILTNAGTGAPDADTIRAPTGPG